MNVSIGQSWVYVWIIKRLGLSPGEATGGERNSQSEKIYDQETALFRNVEG